MNNPTQQTIEVNNGDNIILETGKFAKQADGAVMLKQGNTMLLATVVSAREMRPGTTFFPLSVDYQEKFASSGKIPGGFKKREGRLSDYEILTSRLIDRTIRPLFPDGYQYDTQVMISLLSADDAVLPDALAALATSAALAVSDIPFNGPISEVRVGRVNGEFIINPTRNQLAESDIDMIVGATYDNVMMVEGEMKEISEEDMIQAIRFGHNEVKKHCQAQIELSKTVGSFENKREYTPEPIDQEFYNKVESAVKDQLLEIARSGTGKDERRSAFAKVHDDFVASLGEDAEAELISKATDYISKVKKETIRNMMIDEGKRLDGRDFKEVRPIEVEAGVLPSPHGSALFTRGETQALVTVTLGNKMDEKMVDNALEDTFFDNFFLHYNFPAFSVGEVRPNRGPGRREIGHGNLAFRSLQPVMPNQEECPYTIRIVSDILESNGSSSMATVCGGSLALMDAGVKIKNAVSGIAMGMVSREDGKHAILTDILGDEDHLGDMDFKVTGTENGICACQMDIKIDGLSDDLLREALMQAKEGRTHILNKMNEVISTSREDYKETVPKMVKIVIPGDTIGAVIGPGGKVIKELQETTNTTITIDEDGDKGIVAVSSKDREGLETALEKIKLMTTKPTVGEVYEAVVKNIMPYGAFVEFLPKTEGLLHISEISWSRIENVEDVLSEGDKIKVELKEVDQKRGKYSLSRKNLIPKPETQD